MWPADPYIIVVSINHCWWPAMTWRWLTIMLLTPIVSAMTCVASIYCGCVLDIMLVCERSIIYSQYSYYWYYSVLPSVVLIYGTVAKADLIRVLFWLFIDTVLIYYYSILVVVTYSFCCYYYLMTTTLLYWHYHYSVAKWPCILPLLWKFIQWLIIVYSDTLTYDNDWRLLLPMLLTYYWQYYYWPVLLTIVLYLF